jgi:hypothetical protein
MAHQAQPELQVSQGCRATCHLSTSQETAADIARLDPEGHREIQDDRGREVRKEFRGHQAVRAIQANQGIRATQGLRVRRAIRALRERGARRVNQAPKEAKEPPDLKDLQEDEETEGHRDHPETLATEAIRDRKARRDRKEILEVLDNLADRDRKDQRVLRARTPNTVPAPGECSSNKSSSKKRKAPTNRSFLLPSFSAFVFIDLQKKRQPTVFGHLQYL